MEEVAYRLESALEDEDTEKPSDVFGPLLEDGDSMVAFDNVASISDEVDGARYGVEFYDVQVDGKPGDSARVAMVFDAERNYHGGWIDYGADTSAPVEWDEDRLREVAS